MSVASSFRAVRLTVVASRSARGDGLPGAGRASADEMDKMAARTGIRGRGFLVSLAIRAVAEGSCPAPGCGEAELHVEKEHPGRSNGKVSLRDAVLRATGHCRSGRRTAQCGEAHTLVISWSLAHVEQVQRVTACFSQERRANGRIAADNLGPRKSKLGRVWNHM